MKRGTIWNYIGMLIIFLLILYYFRNSEHILGAIAFALTILCFYLADSILKLDFKTQHYFILIFMSTVGILLSPVYFMLLIYDKILHLTFPFLGCFLIFYLVNKLKIDFKTKVMFTFTIMISLLVLEEIVEFSLDWFFDLKLQGVFSGERVLFEQKSIEQLKVIQSRITDTMIDLILGVCGSFIFVLGKFLKLIK